MPVAVLYCCVRYDFVIVSYDMLKDVSEVLGAVGFKVVILDESHCIKNPTVRMDASEPHSTTCCQDLHTVKSP